MKIQNMESIFIWGTGQLGIKVMNKLQKNGRFVNAFIDKNSQKENINDIRVMTCEEFKRYYQNEKGCVLISATNARNIFEIFDALDTCPSFDAGIVKPRNLASEFKLDIQNEQDNGEIIWKRRHGKAYCVIPRIEVNLIDQCNLKCKACTHFSSLYEKDTGYPINNFTKDLEELRKVGKLLRLRLLGGEPFLLKNLERYLYTARAIFPEADIEVVTNGLLVPEIKEGLMDVFCKNKVTLIISLYPPTVKIKSKIENKLSASNIIWRYEGKEIQKFGRNLTLTGNHDIQKSSKQCLSFGCTFLRNGYLYKCPFDGLFDEFCDYYNLKIDVNNNGYSVYKDKKELYEDIKRLSIKPVEMCKFCSETTEMIPWEVKNKPKLEDWLYQEGR